MEVVNLALKMLYNSASIKNDSEGKEKRSSELKEKQPVKIKTSPTSSTTKTPCSTKVETFCLICCLKTDKKSKIKRQDAATIFSFLGLDYSTFYSRIMQWYLCALCHQKVEEFQRILMKLNQLQTKLSELKKVVEEQISSSPIKMGSRKTPPHVSAIYYEPIQLVNLRREIAAVCTEFSHYQNSTEIQEDAIGTSCGELIVPDDPDEVMSNYEDELMPADTQIGDLFTDYKYDVDSATEDSCDIKIDIQPVEPPPKRQSEKRTLTTTSEKLTKSFDSRKSRLKLSPAELFKLLEQYELNRKFIKVKGDSSYNEYWDKIASEVSKVDGKVYTSRKCEKLVNLAHDLAQIKTKEGKFLYRCLISPCTTRFSTMKYVESHFKRQHMKMLKPFICSLPNCSKAFRRPNKLKDHMQVHLKPEDRTKDYPCDVCHKYLDSVDRLRSHKRMKHGKLIFKYQCIQCDKKFVLPSLLKSHMLSHTTERPFLCDLCPLKFKVEHALRYHKLRKHEKKGYGMCVCDICGKQLTPASMKRHKYIHTGQRPFQCKFTGCDYSGRGTNDTKRHYDSIHGGVTFECNICHKKFSTASSLGTHKKTHQTDVERKKFTCEICLRNNFFSSAGLKKHIEIAHNEGVTHKCLCGETFPVGMYLQRHIRYFAKKLQEGDITEHRPLEAGETGREIIYEFHCEICNKGFHRLQSKTRHEEYFHNSANINKYKCICGYAVSVKFYLGRHIKYQHDRNQFGHAVVE